MVQTSAVRGIETPPPKTAAWEQKHAYRNRNVKDKSLAYKDAIRSFSEHLEDLHSERLLSGHTVRRVLEIAELYGNRLQSKEAEAIVLYAMVSMIDNSVKNKTYGRDIKIEKIAIQLEDRNVQNEIADTMEIIHKADPNAVHGNLYLVVYNTGDISKYDKKDIRNDCAKIRSIYGSHETYLEFFKTFMDKKPEVPIVLNRNLPLETLGIYKSGLKEVQINPNVKENYVIAHELAHSIQYTGKKGVYYRSNNMDSEMYRVEGHYKLYDFHYINIAVLESGAMFAGALYTEYEKSGKNINSEAVLRTLREDFNSFADEKYKLKDPKRAFDVTLSALYKTMRRNGNVHVNMYEDFEDQCRPYNRNGKRMYGEYVIGAVLASVVYAANNFDTAKTMNDLLNAKHSGEIIEKVAKILKEEKGWKTLLSIPSENR